MTEKPRLVITGLGVVAPNGIGNIPCGQLASRIVESPYHPKEVIVYGLNLEASDKQAMEQLGVQYVDQRRTFTKLITTVKQTALRQGLRNA